MANYTGFAELPLHDGRVPEYLLKRMRVLGSLIAKYIIEIYGPRELLLRLSDPFWFQAFNNIIGMDWDSSGSTTVTLYVLKSAFPPGSLLDRGVSVLGGKGSDARSVPEEARLLGDTVDPSRVVELSGLSARVDSVAIQDGYTLYIHGVLVSESGDVLVVQQGMNLSGKLARRYHIFVERSSTITCEQDPHSGVASMKTSPGLNLVDRESSSARRALVEIVESTPLESLVQHLHRVNRLVRGLPELTLFTTRTTAPATTSSELREKFLKCPRFYRPVTDIKRVERVAELIKRQAPLAFRDLILVEGLGPETLRALALIADLIYGYEPSFKDPTTHPIDPFLYAYAHGGKDGVPYKIRPRDIDKTLEFFTRVVDAVRAGDREKELLMRNLAKLTSRLKRLAYYSNSNSS
jgi:hypothetical protein